jgi:hypothetical protein
VFKVEARGAFHEERNAVAEGVLAQFAGRLPDLGLLCLLDDKDWEYLKGSNGAGEANRGFFTRTRTGTRLWPEWQNWPDDLKDLVLIPDLDTWKPHYAFDCLVYLHGSTCASSIGLAMTLAHELQHFCQYGNQRGLWAVNILLQNLRLKVDVDLKLWDLPIEQDARIKSKEAALQVCGEEAVRQYIDEKIREAVDENDASDWKFVRALQTSNSYELAAETALVLRRFLSYRHHLQNLLSEQKDDADFANLELAQFY